jgi:hypothetical protein
VSEEANGKYGWGSVIYVWHVGAQQLGTRIRALVVETRAVGLCFLMASGVGEAMASVFDINHQCTILPSQSVSKCR